MSPIGIIEILIVVLCAVAYGVALYFRTKGDLFSAVTELIARAEESDLPGKEKMAGVVAELYKRVPEPFKGVLNEEAIRRIAQHVFDWMRQYANTYNNHTEADTQLSLDSWFTQVNKDN